MRTKNYGEVVTIYEIINENSYLYRSRDSSAGVRYCKASRSIIRILDNESTKQTTWIPPTYHCIVYNIRFRNVFIYTNY